jgi:hypothetical protein
MVEKTAVSFLLVVSSQILSAFRTQLQETTSPPHKAVVSGGEMAGYK